MCRAFVLREKELTRGTTNCGLAALMNVWDTVTLMPFSSGSVILDDIAEVIPYTIKLIPTSCLN
jgi:hypothetical protein